MRPCARVRRPSEKKPKPMLKRLHALPAAPACRCGGGGQGAAGDCPPHHPHARPLGAARKDTLLPAAKKRPNLSAADAVKMQQDVASGSGSGGGGKSQ